MEDDSNLACELVAVPLALVVGATVLVAGGAGMAVGASSAHPTTVKVCVTKKGVVRAASAKGKCPKKTHRVVIGVKGPEGEAGAPGAPGAKGDAGATGPQGPGADAVSGTVGNGLSTTTVGLSAAGATIGLSCGSGYTRPFLSIGSQHVDVGGSWGSDTGSRTSVALADQGAMVYLGPVSMPHSYAGHFVVSNLDTGKVSLIDAEVFDPTVTGNGSCKYHFVVDSGLMSRAVGWAPRDAMRSPLALVVGATVLVAGGAGVAVGASSAHPKAVKVCVTKKGVVRAASAKGKCPRHTHKVSVSTRGPAGPRGATGAVGATGTTGPRGPGARSFDVTLTAGSPTDYRKAILDTGFFAQCYADGEKVELVGDTSFGWVGIWTQDTSDAYDSTWVHSPADTSYGHYARAAGSLLFADLELEDLNGHPTGELTVAVRSFGSQCRATGQFTPAS